MATEHIPKDLVCLAKPGVLIYSGEDTVDGSNAPYHPGAFQAEMSVLERFADAFNKGISVTTATLAESTICTSGPRVAPKSSSMLGILPELAYVRGGSTAGMTTLAGTVSLTNFGGITAHPTHTGAVYTFAEPGITTSGSPFITRVVLSPKKVVHSPDYVSVIDVAISKSPQHVALIHHGALAPLSSDRIVTLPVPLDGDMKDEEYIIEAHYDAMPVENTVAPLCFFRSRRLYTFAGLEGIGGRFTFGPGLSYDLDWVDAAMYATVVVYVVKNIDGRPGRLDAVDFRVPVPITVIITSPDGTTTTANYSPNFEVAVELDLAAFESIGELQTWIVTLVPHSDISPRPVLVTSDVSNYAATSLQQVASPWDA